MVQGRVVITGGHGFVGRYLAAELKKESRCEVAIWDLPAVDITKPKTYRNELKRMQPDWVVHLAAVASAAAAGKDPTLARRVNVKATEDLLMSMLELCPSARMLAVSTGDIYGQGTPPPMRRAGLPELPLAQARPRNPYAQTKWEMEKMIADNFNDRVVRVRPFPHIGPGQTRGYVTADFASQIATIELKKIESIIRVGNLEAERDFTDVRDVVRAYRLLLERGQTGEVYHVASGRAVRIKEILNQLLAMAKVKIEVKIDESKMRPSDTPVIVGDASKLHDLSGWRPEIDLEVSLRDVLNWWRQSVESVGVS